MDPAAAFEELPDPARATGLDELAEQLRLLKIWAGDPSYETIRERVNAAWAAAGRPAGELARRSTVADCFRTGRRRFNTDLVIEVVRALHPDTGYVAQWRQALRVLSGESEAASQVRVQDRLPPDPAGFTGRGAELDRLRRAARSGDSVVISAIEGMPGVGKTQLALHAGHVLLREEPFDRVLFVNLRGFHPDPAQPPADPAAVLDGFLRLLGVPGRQLPHGLAARTAAYRERLAGTRTLVVLDDVATAAQVRPLLPATPGCLALITSRRRLGALRPATRLTVDVFTPGEAVAYLRSAAPGTPVGTDPRAAARIARRCGHLPLALSLVAGHIRGTPGWTLTDHADRLDQRHRERRLDSGVELALALSYQELSVDLRLLLRMAALHPGQDLDAYAAAALTGTDPGTARTGLDRLRDDHLLQQPVPGRYAFHDLVRAHATTRAQDEDRPPDRRAALTRLSDYYVAATAAAMDTLHPAEAHLRPRIAPIAGPLPDLSDPDTALDWLNSERPTLVAIAARGPDPHTVRLSRTLFRYLTGGHLADALTVHGHAVAAARRAGDTLGQAHALTDLGGVHWRLGRPEDAARHFTESLALFGRAGDSDGEARALTSLGIVADRGGRPDEAIGLFERALTLFAAAGNRTGEARTLNNVANVEARRGHSDAAAAHWARAMRLFHDAGDRAGEANALNGLGDLEVQSGRFDSAAERFQRALTLYRQIGNRAGEANILDSLGMLHTRLGRPDQATDLHRLALTMYRETGDRYSEARAHNGLAEAARAAGRFGDALAHHEEALAIADGIGSGDEQARARTGIAELRG